MSQLQGFTPYERNHIDSNGDYVKESVWTHSDTVEAPDGDLLSNKLSRGIYLSDEVETEQTEIIPLSIDDNGVSTTSAWSSSKVKSVTDSLGTRLDNFTEIADNVTAENSTWSSSKLDQLLSGNGLFSTILDPGESITKIGNALFAVATRLGLSSEPDIHVFEKFSPNKSTLGSTRLMQTTGIINPGTFKVTYTITNNQSSQITVMGIVF